jgi:uncharacterized protein (DUF885 family)
MRCLRRALAAGLLGLLMLSTAGAQAPDPAETAKAHALFERVWDEGARLFPEWATYRGDHRYGDRLTDTSPAARAQLDRRVVELLEQARAIRRQALSPTDRVSLDMFIDQQQRQLDQQAFKGWRLMSVGALGGTQSQFAELMQVVPMATAAQARQLLARMAAYPRRMDDDIANLRQALAAGWVPSRDVLGRVLQQIDAQLQAQPDNSPFWRPFTRLGRDIAAAEQAELQAAGRQAIAQQVLPALRRLRAFVADEYLPRAPADGALLHYPDGPRVYALQVRNATTTELTPQQIHELGLREMARLRGEVDQVLRELKFDGGFAAFVQHARSEPRFLHGSPEALLAGYRDIAKRLDGELPRLFAELPRMPYTVRPMPDYMGPNRAEYYDGPALDGTRAGTFYAATAAWRKRPIWSMETLVAHEAVPGHHLQVARAQELRGLPNFRRQAWGYTAYVEGWALYAETLGFELGLFTDPYSRYGFLDAQLLRAARLVVDTGMHALGWPRQRCIDYMVNEAGVEPEFAASEVDRYSSWPGQALGYMIGRMKFEQLRDRAKAALGPRFDIRRFHNAVLDQGALPLSALERLVDDWIAQQQQQPPAAG